MQHVAAVLASAVRRAQLVGGRHDGAVLPLLCPSWPASLCLGLPGAEQHYVHEATMPGMYVHVGACADMECGIDGTRSGGPGVNR